MNYIDQPDWRDTVCEPIRVLKEMWNTGTKLVPSVVKSKVFDEPKPLDKGLVIISSGFLAHHWTVEPAAFFLRHHGYDAVVVENGINTGGWKELQNLLDTIDRESDRCGEAATLLGHSLGGMQSTYATYIHEQGRQTAVKGLITLGSPIHSAMGEGGAIRFLEDLFHILNEDAIHIASELNEFLRNAPPQVGVTSFHSPLDGIVRGEASKNPWHDGVKHRNIEIKGSHCGMVINHTVAAHLLEWLEFDRMKQNLPSLDDHEADQPLIQRI